METCSNPGCDQPGTNQCSACKTTVYCCVICQTADWAHHKEECQGHLRKVGKANLEKAKGFHQQQNWVQALRYGELAAIKLKQLKDRRLETVELIDDALMYKFNTLQRLARHRKAMECIKECYTLWAMNHMRNPGSMRAALGLIQSCIHNKEYEDAERYARHAYFMINEMTDNFIPTDQQPRLLADVSYWLAVAIYRLAKAGGIPPEEKQKAGEEAIEHARKALEIHTQLHGNESAAVAADMGILAEVLAHFNNVDDYKVLRLQEQAIAIYRRVEGSSSMNVAVSERNLGTTGRTERRLPMMWTGSWLIWSWRCPTIVKQFVSTGSSITWTVLTRFFASSLKSRKTFDGSELPEQQQQQQRAGAEYIYTPECTR